MNITRWAPFREMESLMDNYHGLREHRGRSDMNAGLMDRETDWCPSADISETDDQFVIKANLPEVEKDDVHVSIEDGILTISGERRYEKEQDSETQHRIESMYGKFSRSFTLPTNADESHIKADSHNGVLKVHIPKVVKETPKPLEIEVH